MAEVSRRDTALGNPQASQEFAQQPEKLLPEETEPLPGMPVGSNLPGEGASNSRLNWSATQIGRGVGTAARRLHIVGGRRHRAGLMKEEGLGATAERKAAEWRDAAGEKLSEVTAAASARTLELAESAEARLSEFRRSARQYATEAGESARERIQDARRTTQYWRREYPLQVIMGFAGAAFVMGAALRVWRSNRD